MRSAVGIMSHENPLGRGEPQEWVKLAVGRTAQVSQTSQERTLDLHQLRASA